MRRALIGPIDVHNRRGRKQNGPKYPFIQIVFPSTDKIAAPGVKK